MTRLTHPNEFKTGTRILIRIKRSKDGEAGSGGDRAAKKIITENPEEYEAAVDQLIAGAESGERVYATVDARKWHRAIRCFKQNLLDNDYNKDQTGFYRDVFNRVVSCLQSPKARDTSLFLFDCDSDDDYRYILRCLMTAGVSNVIHQYPTKNGYHIITKPFEYPRFIDPSYHRVLHTNALMLIAY